jgi:hypothetical protein
LTRMHGSYLENERPGRVAGPSSPRAVSVQNFGAKSNPLALLLTTTLSTSVKKL